MSDYNLRPPHSPSGAAGSLHRASSPGPISPQTSQQQQQQQQQQQSRYSMGKMSGGPVKSPSLSNAQMASVQANNQARMSMPLGTPTSARPSSEMIGGMGGAMQGDNAEVAAIDKWFEDLRHYEATLEEMAAASLDQNFKEELSAIEQWFRVLSEAERTAALYSLLQESTQVQIRFFITVLQQMARSDPMSALLSPSHHASNNMADQMEAKLASLGLKSPSAAMKSPASPGARNYRQSSDAAGFLSPNLASMYGAPGSSEAAAMLAAQRAKLKANRISAPGTLAGDGGRNFSNGGSLDQVAEARAGGASPGAQHRSLAGGESGATRPKSTDGLSAASRSPRPSGPLDDQLSPIQTGSWASMTNTPLMSMFDDGQNSQADLDAAAAQLASVGSGNSRVLIDQDISKYRRKSGNGVPGQSQTNVQGVLSGMYDGASPAASPNLPGSANSTTGAGPWSANQNDFLRHAMANVSPAGSNASFNMAMSPNALAGLQSPSGGLGNPLNMQMMNAMAAMGGLGNMSAAQFIAMQQQILHSQQQIAAMAAGGIRSGNTQRQGSAGMGGFNAGLSPGNAPNSAGRRSPAPVRTPNTARSNVPSSAGAGAGEEEVPPLNVLEDIPAWLRHLRLHKYTANFEGSQWRDMVLMDDKALEDKGVAALGARRKMLKTFELVREKYNIPHPNGAPPAVPSKDDPSAAGAGAEAEGKAAEEATA